MIRARPEAQFYRWRRLTKEQRRVATDIQNWLSPPYPGDQRSQPARRSIFEWQRIDEKRTSNVIVIDGPRGAGKTSLMVTLVELWRRSLAREPLDKAFGAVEEPQGEVDLSMVPPLLESPPAQPGGDANSITSARSQMEQSHNQIIPIRVLDFAPLPPSTSIITWVAAQLREFIDMLDERMTSPLSNVSARSVVPWEPDWDKELPSRRAWADLVSSAAWGWDDNINARKSALDPDAYAEELQQSERARVGIVERWQTLIRTIVSDACQRHHGRISPDARLLIPIDDVDMNPQRTTDLLEFVRTFWDPQLVFLLSGDSELIIAALQQQHSRTFGLKRDSATGDLPSVRDIAAQTYDKVVPLAQRFRFEPLALEERIALLSEQLGPRLLPPTPSRPMQLQDLLRQDPWATEALPPTLREIQDLRQKLAKHQTVSQVVADLWLVAVSRETLDEAKHREIAARVDFGAEGMPSVEGAFEVAAERLGDVRVESSAQRGEQRRERAHLVLEAPSSLVPIEFPSSRRLHGAFLLAADLVAMDPDAAWSAISITGRGYKFPAVRARIVASIMSKDSKSTTVEQRAETVLRRGMRWPVPNWPAPVDMARFAKEWRSFARAMLERRDDQTRARSVAATFLGLIRFVYHDHESVSWPSTSPESVGATELRTIIQAVVKDGGVQAPTPQVSPRRQAYVEWARVRAPLLATPESGLNVGTAQEIVSALPPTPPYDEHELRRARFERVQIHLTSLGKEPVGPERVHAVLEDIDNTFEGHPWVVRFKPWDRAAFQDTP